MAKQIQISIAPDGKITATTKNIKGKSCLKYVEPLEKMLDARAVDSTFTEEYYATEQVVANEANVGVVANG